jgi:hypothetical protein
MPLFFNKLICGLLITLLVVPTALFVAPKQAEAMPTMDPNTLMLVIKEYILDIIGWVMSELLLALTTSEIAEWANNNFGGMVLTYNEATGTFNYEWVNNDASFLASPDKFFTNLALGVGMHALEGTSPTFQTIFPDWDSTMLISLREDLMRLEQSFEERYRPTMDAADLENLFANLGEGGGWSAWLEMATNPQNNIHGALRLAREEATRQIQIAQSQTRDDLQQGGGFLTARNCVDVQPNHPDADIFGCLRYENVTPGSAIRGQVGQALGIDLEKKAQADEITEVIAQFIAGALLNLIEQGLSTIGSSTLSTYPITTSGSPEHSCPSTMNAEQCQAYLMEQAQAERERQIEEAREEYERERDDVVDEIRQPGDPGYVEPITQRTLTLTAQATSASNIHLSWTTNAPDGTEFQIFRRDSAGNFVQLPGSTDTSQTTTPLHRYVDARLNPNSTYTYFVKSVDGTYSSAEVSATTSHLNSTDHTQIMAALTNVSSFRANTVESNSVTLTWGSLPGHTFRIYRNGQRITEAVAGSMSFVDESVAHSTTYRYSITAVLEGQETRMSPPVAVTTPRDPNADDGTTLPPTPIEGPTTTTTYRSTTENFPNPERGWYTGGLPTNYARAASGGYRLVMRYVRLDDYRNSALPQGFLDQLSTDLSGLRTHGLKVVLRFSYNFGFAEDAPLDRVLQHIEQLTPVLRAHTDVIAMLQSGFIGAWGEWHSSTNNLLTQSNRQSIANALLNAMASSRMIQIRTPYHARDIFTLPTAATAFSGNVGSRVGQVNDCFLTNASDAGTFISDADWAYAEAVSRYTVQGGETCDVGGLNSRNDGANAVNEMARFHYDYLNVDFWEPIISKWRNQGYFDEISRRLGYRYVMIESVAQSTATPGGNFSLNLTLRNEGFGKLYNPRPIQVVLRPVAGGTPIRLRANDDARRSLPLAGATITMPLTVQLPTNLSSGSYDVFLALPDGASALAGDARYAIRFANEYVWNGTAGWNALNLQLNVQ